MSNDLQPTPKQIRQEIAEALPFSKKLALIRKATGLTYGAIAQHVGVSRAAVSKWKKGASAPTERHINKLAALIGMEEGDLMVFQNARKAATFRNMGDNTINIKMNVSVPLNDAVAIRRIVAQHTQVAYVAKQP